MPMAGEQTTTTDETVQAPAVTDPATTEAEPEAPATTTEAEPEAPAAEKRLIVYRNGMEITDEQREANGVVGVKLWPGMRLWV